MIGDWAWLDHWMVVIGLCMVVALTALKVVMAVRQCVAWILCRGLMGCVRGMLGVGSSAPSMTIEMPGLGSV